MVHKKILAAVSSSLFLFFVLSPSFVAAESYINKVKNQKYNGNISIPQQQYNVTVKSLGKMLRKYKKEAKKSEIKINKGSSAAVDAEVAKIKAALNSPEMRKQIVFDTKQFLGNGEFGKYVPKSAKKKYLSQIEHGGFMKQAGGNRLFLVISSSVPYRTLRRYVLQIAEFNLPVQMVLRGLVHSGNGRYIMPTVKYIETLIRFKGKSGYYDMHVDIDPVITEKYDIRYAPALVYAENYNPGTFTDLGDTAYVAYGDDDLKYLIKKIYKRARTTYLKKVLKDFKSGSYFFDK